MGQSNVAASNPSSGIELGLVTPHQVNPPRAKSRSGVVPGSVFKGVVAAWCTGTAPSDAGANATFKAHERGGLLNTLFLHMSLETAPGSTAHAWIPLPCHRRCNSKLNRMFASFVAEYLPQSNSLRNFSGLDNLAYRLIIELTLTTLEGAPATKLSSNRRVKT